MSEAQYFKADTIDHYRIEIDEEALSTLEQCQSHSETELLKIKVLFDEQHPKTVQQTPFITALENLGFNKTTIEEPKFSEIQSIFKLTDISSTEISYCGAVFRDVLVFYWNNQITGIAKLCFSCGHHVIVGTSLKTTYFGQKGAYEALHKLLNG